MPNRLGRSCPALRNGRGGAAMLPMTLKRAADHIPGAKPDRQGECENNASEQDAECQLHNISAHFKMIEHHGRGEHQHQPLNAQRQDARVLQLRVHRADENGSRQEARNQSSCHQQQDCAHRVREIREQRNGQRRAGGIGGVEG